MGRFPHIQMGTLEQKGPVCGWARARPGRPSLEVKDPPHRLTSNSLNTSSNMLSMYGRKATLWRDTRSGKGARGRSPAARRGGAHLVFTEISPRAVQVSSFSSKKAFSTLYLGGEGGAAP